MLTIVSLVGVVLSVGLWGVSYFRVHYVANWRGPTSIYLNLEEGCVKVGRVGSGIGGAPATAPPDWIIAGFQSFDTNWSPRFGRPGQNLWGLLVPFWIPAVLFSTFVFIFYAPLHRRRKRRNLGLCEACGYSLQGLTEPRCPECNTAF